jgi:iduronate 2-sulfatase
MMKRLSAVTILLLATYWAGSLTASRPHVLFIAIDDLRPELGCYGNTEVKSPNIDRIASEGTVFQRAYCQQALCGPSRLSLMTGMYPDSLGIWGMSSANKKDWRKLYPEITSLSEQFRNHGYKAIGFGKIYDNRLGLDMDHSWDSFVQGWKGKYVRPENKKTSQEKGGNGKPAMRAAFEGEDVPDETFTDGSNTRLALEALRKHDPNKPLFLAVGFAKPHLPFIAPKKYWDLYDAEKLTLASRKLPPHGHSEYLLSRYKEIFAYAVPDPVPLEMERTLVHGYYACVSYVDAQIGKLVNALKKKGMYENTLIVIWGDHGFKLGDFSEWAKHTNLELDARVPLIIRESNDARTGTKTDALVELVDVLPTMCELAGLPIPANAEGQSLVPAMKDPTVTIRDSALTQYPRQNDTMSYSIRTDGWRYIETRYKKSGKVAAAELYNLHHGWIEQENVIRKEPEVARQHSEYLDTRINPQRQ